MKIKKYGAFMLAAVFSCAGTFAQDFDDFGDFGDFGDVASGVSNAAKTVSISGEASLEARGYFDTDSTKDGINTDGGIKNTETVNNPSAKLNFKYSGATVESEIKLKFDKNTLDENKKDILDEFTVRGLFMENALTLEAGKMRTIWGKGDRLHVIDNFNADDYTDFIVPLYTERRIAIPMFKASYAIPKNNMVLEAIWTPGMEADRFSTDGRWAPAEANKYNSDPTAIYPDTDKLKYNQAGLRLTGTVGNLDLGLSYYYGHYKQVSANMEKYLKSTFSSTSTPKQATALPELDFDRKQTFGIEAATILWKFNLRSELCYNLTSDTAGDDPWVHNNSVQWLAGFDIDLPINNINVNIQETGTYILDNDKIKNGDGIEKAMGMPLPALKGLDVDYDAKDRYTTNHLVVNITDSWKNGKIEPEVTALWSIERGDLAVMPKVEFNPNQDITFTVSGLIMYAKDENSEFAEWSGKGNGTLNNSYMGIGVKCKF